MRRLIPLVVPLALVSLVACTGAEDDTDSDTDEVLPTAPGIPTSACAPAPYDWVPFDQMGQIVAIEAAEDLSLQSGLIDIALRSQGLDQFVPVPYGVRAWRVRYTTQDKGRVIEATAVLAIPDTTEPMETPVVAWGHGTSGFIDECAPSANDVIDNAGAILLASQGFAVAAPDYIGLNGFGEPSESLHPYLVVEPAAVATLDSIRAMWNLEASLDFSLPVTPTRQVGLWGASEGGFHVLWADRYMEHYLPEGELVATVAAVPPSDLQGLAEVAIQDGPLTDATGGMMAGLVGMASWHGDESIVSDILVDPWDTRIVEAMHASCNPSSGISGIDSLDDAVPEELLSEMRVGNWPEPFACHLFEGTLHASTVPRSHDTPVFYQISAEDELVVGHVVREDAGRLCEAGYRLDFLECSGVGHVTGAAQSLPVQLEWLNARFAGEPLTTVCDLDDVRDCSEYLDF